MAEKPQRGPEVYVWNGQAADNLNAAAIAGLLMAGMWPGFDESVVLLLRKPRAAAVQGNEVFDDVVGVRMFWKGSAERFDGDDAVAAVAVTAAPSPLHAESG